ncbi:D-2-hydroxyacid dehydrogenase [Bacillaceae bacterium SIJ1]|uniref:D-2-hydroxyacid dehydrogenase n=1 Tax=Litoribacterium kuwaitense TaxID=1398745 RepID=UPI0013ED280D|nr:D-2-hydroxyacid dehydrogenase [Litoribacterium kuwaitense]NGP45876.1 D-2-hydroxyacid dehydrogenase [Litoribacterium kuwaitense]
MNKIMMFGAREDEKEAALTWAKVNNVDITFSKEILKVETVEQLKGFDGVTTQQTGRLDDSIYERLSKLGMKQIAQRSAGYDMYNLEKAAEYNIIISNVPSYSPNSVAEYAVTAALQLIRKTHLINQKVEEKDFRWQKSIMAKEVKTLEVAIIGTGRIGQITAKIFKGFGAKVVGYDLYPNEHAEQYLEYKNSIEETVSNADIVSIHMPATKDNYHLFNEELFNQFKDDAVFINTARGSIVDTRALLKALEREKIAGAALDTYENESTYYPKDFRDKEISDSILTELVTRPDVILTPHIAFYTDVAVKNLVEGGLDAALSVIETGTCETRIN